MVFRVKKGSMLAVLGLMGLLGRVSAEEPLVMLTPGMTNQMAQWAGQADTNQLALWLGEARSALASGRLEEARSVLTNALAAEPENPYLHLELGSVDLASGNEAEAVRRWELLYARYYNDATLKNNLAWLYATGKDPQVRNPEKAVVMAREALQIRPLDYHVWNTLAMACHAHGEYALAFYAAGHTLELAESDTNATPNELEEFRKNIRANQKLSDAIAPGISEALSEQKREGEQYWTKMGQYEMKMGRPREALAAFGIARTYNPQSRSARFGEATIYLLLKEYRKGVEILEQLAAEYPGEYAIINNIAWVYATAEDFSVRDTAKSIAYAQDALLLSPDNYHIWSTLSEAYFVAGQYEKSVRAAEEAIRQGRLSNATPGEIQGYERQLARGKRAADAMSLVE